MGTATGLQGEFRISKIPPGTYTLVVSMIGYQRIVVDQVAVVASKEQFLSLKLMPTFIETEQVVITANRREQSLQDVPVSVSTVTAKMIAERNTVTLDDALRYVPGVNMTYDQVNIRGSSGYSRGVGSRVLLLLDGLPFLTGDTGEINWETIPVYQVERIEIVKGAGSALYGSSALGGVINVITRDVQDSPELRIRLYTGLYDQPRFSEWRWSTKSRFNSGLLATYSNKTGGLGYLLSATRTVDDSYRQNDAYHRWSLYSKLRYDFSSSQSITVTANYLQRVHGNFFWWRNLREATKPADDQLDGQVDSRRGNIGISYKEFLSEKFFYTVKGIYFVNYWEDSKLGKRNYISTSHLANLDVQGTYEFSKENVLTFGVAGNYDLVDANLFGKHPGVGAAAYVQDEVELLPKLKATAGLRFDWQKVSVLPSTSQVNPKLGFVYSPDRETSLRASFGSGFRYPAIGELYIESPQNISNVPVLPNVDLMIEQSVSFEIGGSRSLADRFFVDAAVFTSSFKNLIEPGVAFNERNEAYIKFDNVTKARITGGEVGLRIEWWKKVLSSDLGYTYIWPRDLNENAILKFRPRHMFYVSGSLSYDHLRTSADFRYLSRVERIDENLVRFAPIIHGDQLVPIKVVDVRAWYELVGLGLPIRIGFNVNNLTNYHYVELIGNLAPVRTYFITVDGVW